jgi:hypothetical protein
LETEPIGAAAALQIYILEDPVRVSDKLSPILTLIKDFLLLHMLKLGGQIILKRFADWIDIAQDRDQWRALVRTIMNIWLP